MKFKIKSTGDKHNVMEGRKIAFKGGTLQECNAWIKLQPIEFPEGITFSDCVKHFAAPADDPYVIQAHAQYHTEGEVEIDKGLAVFSEGDSNGKYVMAWVWVGDADVPEVKGVGDDD